MASTSQYLSPAEIEYHQGRYATSASATDVEATEAAGLLSTAWSAVAAAAQSLASASTHETHETHAQSLGLALREAERLSAKHLDLIRRRFGEAASSQRKLFEAHPERADLSA